MANNSFNKIRYQSSKAIFFLGLFHFFIIFVFLSFARFGLASEGAILLVPKEALDDGGLFFITDIQGLYVPAPILKTDVSMEVNGLVARVKVIQSFTNATDQWVEGIYTYPLPEKAAVDRLTMVIGERRVIGKIKEKEEARKAYDQARREGRRASLVSQQRPNIFTNEVANIGPGETIIIEIEYQDQARFLDGDFELRFPMVVRPRYIPGNKLPVTPEGAGWSFDTDQVPDASRITPPILPPGYGKINPVAIGVSLTPGFQVANLSSPSHDIDIKTSKSHFEISLKKGAVPADSDFILTWSPVPGTTPATGLFSQKIDGDYYHLLMVIPRKNENEEGRKILPREVIFIIDVSGSMQGEAIRQAKAALLLALEGLKPQDSFNIIAFNNLPYDFYKRAIPATSENIFLAKELVSRLVADGGTEMSGALNIALNGGVNLERLRQVVFMTDGAIGNEEFLFHLITENLGDSRLFTVGIGSSPNSHFMREAAEMGKGTFTYIGNLAEVDEKMTGLFRKLESPVLKNLTVQIADYPGAEMFPAKIPDVYAGGPVVVSLKTSGKLKNEIRVSGEMAGSDWLEFIDPVKKSKDSGISALWAREKIRDITNQAIKTGTSETPAVKQAIVEVALAHQMVSKYTSLVAIDKEIARRGVALQSTPIPTNLPKGMDV
ncbi:MAG: marine proteobacterial sortase target protein, partial [Sphingomonadales bacterium]